MSVSEERLDLLIRELAKDIVQKSNGKISLIGDSAQPRALPERMAQNFDALEWRTDIAPSRANVLGDPKHAHKTKK